MRTQYRETRNVLEFVQRACTIPLAKKEDGEDESDEWNDMLMGRGYDPMEGDEFDPLELLNRRTEFIETFSYGSVHARCLGEPDAPLILYLHGRADDPTAKKKAKTAAINEPKTGVVMLKKKLAPGYREATSKTWNGLTKGMADALQALPWVKEEKIKATPRAKPQGTPRSGATPRSDGKKAGKDEEAKQKAAEAKVRKEKAREEEAQAKISALTDTRIELGHLLRQRHRELLQVTRCQVCVAPVTKLRRLTPCKHIVCEACAEEEKLQVVVVVAAAVVVVLLLVLVVAG